MNIRLYPIIAALCALFSIGCTHSRDEAVPVMRVDRALASFASDTPAQRGVILDSMGLEIDAMMAVVGSPGPSEADLVEWSQSRVVKVFQPAVDSVYPPSLDTLEHQLGSILSNADKDSLRLGPLRFASVVWGNPRPIVKVDTILLIALNHYLGADHPGYAQWASYRRREKTPEMLPYDIAAALAATRHPMEHADKRPTLLSWMLYEGALVEARMRLVPEAQLDMALGWAPEQLEFAKGHLPKIWEEMQVRRLLYDTDPLTIDRYIASAPSTALLNSQTPGRIGRYVGYAIVRAYLKRHPDASLPYLLSPAFYADEGATLVESGFSGK